MTRPETPIPALLLLPLLTALGAAACGGDSLVCAFRGTINQPANRSMRKSMMQKGLADLCKQMTSRSAPLRLSPDSPVVGRYYPLSCSMQEGEPIAVKFSGVGYAWTNVTKKMSFTMTGAVQYKYDFLVTEGEECSVYAYLRTAKVDGSDFRVQKIEAPLASTMNALTPIGENFGRQLVAGKLKDGITVIHDTKSGTDDFSLGLVQLGARPFRPYDVRGSERYTVENERTEVHQNQRDFIGPIEISAPGRALFLKAKLDGAAAIDVFIVRKEEGDASLRYYLDYPQTGPLAAPPMLQDVIQAGVELDRTVPLPKGMYYVVLDNTPTAGQVAPPQNAFDDRTAVVNYLIHLSDAP